MPYVVLGVRPDGTRRVLVDGLDFDHAQKTAELIVETGIFREVVVQPEVTVALSPDLQEVSGRG